jgi:hypothetical protein
MILVHACSMIKDEGNKNRPFLSFLDNIGFVIERKVTVEVLIPLC